MLEHPSRREAVRLMAHLGLTRPTLEPDGPSARPEPNAGPALTSLPEWASFPAALAAWTLDRRFAAGDAEQSISVDTIEKQVGGLRAALCLTNEERTLLRSILRAVRRLETEWSLLGVAEDQQNACVDRYIREEVVDRETDLLPAFLPVITPKDEEWDDLQVTFTYEFKNAPYEYHNGGQWSMVTGFHAASLAQRGQREEALRFLDGVHRANRLAVDGQPWSFPEFVHGKTHEPGGVKRMAWSAAGALLAHCVLEGTPVLQDPMKGTSKNPRGRAG